MVRKKQTVTTALSGLGDPGKWAGEHGVHSACTHPPLPFPLPHMLLLTVGFHGVVRDAGLGHKGSFPLGCAVCRPPCMQSHPLAPGLCSLLLSALLPGLRA